MTRGTKLYQQPRSPLIQGHSKTDRPFWQPWLVGVSALVLWVVATVYLSSSGAAEGGSVWQHTSSAWSSDIPWLLAGGIAGSAIGVTVARLWGIRQRWLVAVVAAIGGGYVLSWLAWAAGALI